MRRLALVSLAVTLITILIGQQAEAAPKYTKVTFRDPWVGTEGMKISAGADEETVNFSAGTAVACAQELVTHSGNHNFTITRVGTEVQICHPTNPPQVIHLVNIKKKRICGLPSGAEIASTRLIGALGTAIGGGTVSITVDGLNISTVTSAGQTALQVVQALENALDAAVPDNTSNTFGLEYESSTISGPPVGPVSLGIYELAGRDLNLTSFNSTDAGITLSEPACVAVPTLSEWGALFLSMLILGSGFLVLRRKVTPRTA